MGYRVFCGRARSPDFARVRQSRLYTHHLVREDQQALYGFRTTEELGFFELLTTVTGVGPKVALAIVSARPVADLQLAIFQGDEGVLTAVSGVGKKLAARVVLELKEKVSAAGASATGGGAGGSRRIGSRGRPAGAGLQLVRGALVGRSRPLGAARWARRWRSGSRPRCEYCVGTDEQQRGVSAASSAALVRPIGMAHPPRHSPTEWRPPRPVASYRKALGCHAATYRRATVRAAAFGDTRLLRGWAQPGHHGNERLGRPRASMVAEPSGKAGGGSRAQRWPAHRPRTGGQWRRARPAVEPLAPLR